MAAFLPLFSCMNAIFSILVTVVRQCICVSLPFKAKFILDRASPVFFIYPIIPAGLASLRASFLHLNDKNCLYYLTYPASLGGLVTSTTISIIDISLFFTNFSLASVALHWIRKSAHQAGREVSAKDMQTSHKLFVLNTIGMLLWVLNEVYIMSELMSISISNPIMNWMVVAILPLRPIIYPMMIILHTWKSTRQNPK